MLVLEAVWLEDVVDMSEGERKRLKETMTKIYKIEQ